MQDSRAPFYTDACMWTPLQCREALQVHAVLASAETGRLTRALDDLQLALYCCCTLAYSLSTRFNPLMMDITNSRTHWCASCDPARPEFIRAQVSKCCAHLLIQAKHVMESPLLGVQAYARRKLCDDLWVGLEGDPLLWHCALLCSCCCTVLWR